MKKVDTSSLLLERIEALADGKGDDGRIDYAMESRFQCGTPMNGSPCTTTVITCQGGGTGCTPRKCPYHGWCEFEEWSKCIWKMYLSIYIFVYIKIIILIDNKESTMRIKCG